VCSNCADSEPSDVTTVQPSSSTRTSTPPAVDHGSVVKTDGPFHARRTSPRIVPACRPFTTRCATFSRIAAPKAVMSWSTRSNARGHAATVAPARREAAARRRRGVDGPSDRTPPRSACTQVDRRRRESVTQ
jgi:hypothetical protein